MPILAPPPPTASSELPPARASVDEIANTALLLGGAEKLGTMPDGLLEVHILLVAGLPSRALRHLLDGFVVLSGDELLATVFGMSLRTFQRLREAPERVLDPDQGSRAWRFATILEKCIRLFGTRAHAENWLATPAMALNRFRPIDLLGTCAGVEAVETMLGRIEYGVYM
jgi:putative toxin-antitoxin system antitoxin component (TIGR02293 family)